MANSLDQFSKRMMVRAERFEENVDRLVRKVAIVADQAVVSETPVDTGRARSNWIVSLGAAESNVIEAYAPGAQGSTAAENTQAAINQGQSVIANYQGGLEIHITNNLPYIGELNNGSSAQAPADFVRLAIVAAVRAINRTRVLDG